MARVLSFPIELALVILLASAAVRAQDRPLDDPAMSTEALVHWQEGRRRYLAGELEQALESFARGLAKDPSPHFLYAMGQAERRLGRCQQAIKRFEAFLELSRSETQQALARLQIARCRAAIKEPATLQTTAASKDAVPRPTGKLEVTAGRSTPLTPEEATRGDPPKRAWYRDWAGGALCGAGVAGMTAGAVLLGLGRREPSPVVHSTYGSFDDAVAQQGRLQTWGVVSLALSGALLAAGALRYGLLARRGTPRRQLTLAPLAVGLGGQLAGRF